MTENRYEQLGRKARSELDDLVERSTLPGRIEASVLAAAPKHERQAWRWSLLAGTVVACAAALVLVLRPSPPVTFTIAGEGQGKVGVMIAAEHADKLIAFSEGTTVGLSSGARATIMGVQSHGADIVVQSGTLQAQVPHRTATRWTFHAGPYAVLVTGTRFDLKWDAAHKRMTLLMHEGRVLVSGGAIHSPREVRAGESLVVGGADAESVRPLAPVPDPSPAPVSLVPAPMPVRKQVALAPKPIAHAAVSAASEAFARADQARLQGDESAAAVLFEQVATNHPKDRLAGLASFAAGRLWLVRLHNPRTALVSLERARRLGLRSPLDEDCHARIIEALGLLKNRDACANEKNRYLALFPKGPHADIVANACL